MRVDPAIISAILAQVTATDLENANRAPWWVLAALGFLGGTAGVAKIWSALGKHLDDKREAARRAAEEEKLRRDAKTKAEIEQTEALTSMARTVPVQLEKVTNEIRESNELMRRELAENTRAVNGMVTAWNDEKRVLLAAIAQKLGVQSNLDETNVSGVRRISVPSSPGLEPQTQRA